MTVVELITELSKCNPNHTASFCNVSLLEILEKEIEDDKTYVTTYGEIEVLNRHERGVVLSFKED